VGVASGLTSGPTAHYIPEVSADMARLGIRWNGYITYQTSGAGSWGEPADTCTPTLYTNGGNGGFIIVTATATTWRSDYYTLGSTYPQCTVGGPAVPPLGPGCTAAEGRREQSCCLAATPMPFGGTLADTVSMHEAAGVC